MDARKLSLPTVGLWPKARHQRPLHGRLLKARRRRRSMSLLTADRRCRTDGDRLRRTHPSKVTTACPSLDGAVAVSAKRAVNAPFRPKADVLRHGNQGWRAAIHGRLHCPTGPQRVPVTNEASRLKYYPAGGETDLRETQQTKKQYLTSCGQGRPTQIRGERPKSASPLPAPHRPLKPGCGPGRRRTGGAARRALQTPDDIRRLRASLDESLLL